MVYKKRKKYNMIYSDAGGSSGLYDKKRIYKISLYHSNIDKKECIELELGLDINEAETYGVLNAIVYAITNNLKNVKIHSDSQRACENINIIDFAKKHNIKICWIPRELNNVSNQIIKSFIIIFMDNTL